MIEGPSQIDAPFGDYYALLDRIHEHLRPRGYVEIGVAGGLSLGLTRPGTVAVGVDPEPGEEVERWAPGRRVVTTTSEAFFADHDRADILGDAPLDLAFVDGLHHFEVTLADIAALEQWAHPGTVLLVHDCNPADATMAARERTTLAWAGDVWKVVACLRADRPDLTVTTVDVGPTGLGIITGLGAGFDDLEASIRRHRDLDFAVFEADRQRLLDLVPPRWSAVAPLLRRNSDDPGRVAALASEPVPGRTDGFTVREADSADHEAIIALCAEVFGPHEGASVRHLLTVDGYGPGRWTVAVDAEGQVVSCCTLFTHRLRYGAVDLPAAQIEYVATRASARKHGLVAAQFAFHHRWAEEQGALVVIITGIPYLYRRLGYGYAIEYSAYRRLVEAPKSPEGWVVEPASPADRPALDELEQAAKARQDLTLAWPDTGWDWLLAGSPSWEQQNLVARRDGVVEGYAYIQDRSHENYAEVGGTARTEGAAQALVAEAVTRCGDLNVYLISRPGDPWCTVVERAGLSDPAWFNAVYARIPDPVAFLTAIKDELSARLARSAFAAASGELAISYYEDGLVLTYDNGVVTDIRRDPTPKLDPLDDDEVGIAPDALPALLLGRFEAEELELRYDDVGFVKDRALMATLFPRLSADVWAPI